MQGYEKFTSSESVRFATKNAGFSDISHNT